MIAAALNEATKMIPIYWPLPGFIATNPLWDLHDQPFQKVLESFNNIAHIQGAMPSYFYQKIYAENKISQQDLTRAIDEYLIENISCKLSIDELKKILLQPDCTANHQYAEHSEISIPKPVLVAEYLAGISKKNLSAEIQKAIIKFLMNYFCDQLIEEDNLTTDGVFNCWCWWVARYNSELYAIAAKVETDKLLSITTILNEFNISTDQQTDYFKKIFFYVLGWSSLIKWLEQRPDNPYLKKTAQLIDIVLIWLCYEKYYCKKYLPQLRMRGDYIKFVEKNNSKKFDYRLIWQRALEIAYERNLMSKLKFNVLENTKLKQSESVTQAIFCIDTRSEGIRRHLEKIKRYETFGFAGFFGFVFRYESNTDCQSLQCPALFPPEIYLLNEQQQNYLTKQSQHFLQSCLQTKKSLLPPMVFVEIMGIWFAVMMLIKTFSSKLFKRIKQLVGYDNHENKLNEKISSMQVNSAFSLETKVNNARQFLTTIGLTKEFASLVLICGHGGETDNNPYQASFDCGACGGNAGFPNAVVAAHILNDAEVRKQLKTFNITIPEQTYFIAGFHNTTRDKITLYEVSVPDHLKPSLVQLKQDLNIACANLRKERSQDLPGKSSADERASDWAELIPEMGLINNAALIVGPRHLTRNISLERRVFLHSYDPSQDPDGKLLTGILFGPLIVAHWINAQYYFSTTDPTIYGSGNKMLHNVLPKIGVMEGNFSDLKIGLPWQSIGFQGKILHQPLRLLVVIYARKKLVNDLLEQYPAIKALFDNQWAYLKILEPGN